MRSFFYFIISFLHVFCNWPHFCIVLFLHFYVHYYVKIAFTDCGGILRLGLSGQRTSVVKWTELALMASKRGEVKKRKQTQVRISLVSNGVQFSSMHLVRRRRKQQVFMKLYSLAGRGGHIIIRRENIRRSYDLLPNNLEAV